MMWGLRAVRLAMSGCLVVAEGFSFSSWWDLEPLNPKLLHLSLNTYHVSLFMLSNAKIC